MKVICDAAKEGRCKADLCRHFGPHRKRKEFLPPEFCTEEVRCITQQAKVKCVPVEDDPHVA